MEKFFWPIFSDVWLRRRDIVASTTSAHKVLAVEEAIEAVGAGLRYLPLYSPDLNPTHQLVHSNHPHRRIYECMESFRHAGLCTILTEFALAGQVR